MSNFDIIFAVVPLILAICMLFILFFSLISRNGNIGAVISEKVDVIFSIILGTMVLGAGVYMLLLLMD